MRKPSLVLRIVNGQNRWDVFQTVVLKTFSNHKRNQSRMMIVSMY